MTGEQIGGIARAVLSAVGGFLVGKGYIDSETALAVTGALTTIIVAVWSVKSKKTDAA